MWVEEEEKYASNLGKLIPVEALRGSESSRSWRLPDFRTIGTPRW